MQTSPALRDGSPLPHTLRPGALGRLRNGIRAFPCDKAQRPALSANVGPDIDKSDGAQPSRQRVRRIRPHPVHYGAPPGIPGLLVHDQKHAGRSEYAEHLGKGGGYIRPKLPRGRTVFRARPGGGHDSCRSTKPGVNPGRRIWSTEIQGGSVGNENPGREAGRIKYMIAK